MSRAIEKETRTNSKNIVYIRVKAEEKYLVNFLSAFFITLLIWQRKLERLHSDNFQS